MAVGKLREWSLMADILMMMLVARFVSYFFYRIKIPRLLGDLTAGCLLGPTVLGPALASFFFPQENRAAIKFLGNLGLTLSSIVAGANFDRRVLRGQFDAVLSFSLVNSLVPICAGALPLFHMLPRTESFYGEEDNVQAFFTFLCCVTMASALPFVFLVLDELKLNNVLSRFCIGFACVSTIFLFTLVSVGSSFSNPSITSDVIGMRVSLVVVILVSLVGVQYLWGRAVEKYGPRSWPAKPTTDLCAIIISLGLLLAIATERLGYTFILGAFLFGCALPFNEAVRTEFGKHIKWVSRWILLPCFFLNVGLSFNLREVSGSDVPYMLLVIIFSMVGKLALIPFSYYFLQMNYRQSMFCFSLANARGFYALITGTVARELGVFGNSMFATCVILTLITNIASGPLCRHFLPPDAPFGLSWSRKAKSLAGPPEPKLEMSSVDAAKEPAAPAAAGGAEADAVAVRVAAAGSPQPDDMSVAQPSAASPDLLSQELPKRGASDSAVADSGEEEEEKTESMRAQAKQGQQKRERRMRRGLSDPEFIRSLSETQDLEAVERALVQEIERAEPEEPLYMPRPFMADHDEEFDVHFCVFPEDLVLPMRAGVTRLDRELGGVVAKDLFVGSAAVDWLMATQHYPTRAFAAEICQRLLERGFITHFGAAERFIDGPRVYRFVQSKLPAAAELPASRASMSFRAPRRRSERNNSSRNNSEREEGEATK